MSGDGDGDGDGEGEGEGDDDGDGAGDGDADGDGDGDDCYVYFYSVLCCLFVTHKFAAIIAMIINLYGFLSWRSMTMKYDD